MNALPGNRLAHEFVVRTRTTLAGVGCISLFVNVLMLTIPLYMLQLFNRVLVSESVDTLFHLSVLAVTLLAVQATLEGLRTLSLVRLGAWLEAWLGASVLASRLGSAQPASSDGPQGLRDVAELRRTASDPGMVALFDLPWVPVYLALMFILHPLLGVIGVVGAVVLTVIALVGELVNGASRTEAGRQWLRTTRLGDSLLANAETIGPLGGTGGALEAWRDTGRSAHELQGTVAARSTLLFGLSRFLRYSLQVAVLGGGAFLVVGRELGAGEMVVAAIVLARALQPLDVTLGSWRNLLSARAAWSRVRGLVESTAPPVVNVSHLEPAGPLRAEHVTFQPPGAAAPLLRDVNLVAEPGEVLAVIGPSSAGKSTLARLTVGALRPDGGAIKVGGTDIHGVSDAERGRRIGYLPQSVRFFDGTVEENIAQFSPDGEDTVVEAARNAGAHELILSLPHGYRTVLGSEGLALSGGQAQRIALARALYRAPYLLVLDEPNTGLDGDGEMMLARTIAATRERGAIVMLISHRPNLVAMANRVLLLRDGHVEAFGTKEEVLPPIMSSARPSTAGVLVSASARNAKRS